MERRPPPNVKDVLVSSGLVSIAASSPTAVPNVPPVTKRPEKTIKQSKTSMNSKSLNSSVNNHNANGSSVHAPAPPGTPTAVSSNALVRRANTILPALLVKYPLSTRKTSSLSSPSNSPRTSAIVQETSDVNEGDEDGKNQNKNNRSRNANGEKFLMTTKTPIPLSPAVNLSPSATQESPPDSPTETQLVESSPRTKGNSVHIIPPSRIPAKYHVVKDHPVLPLGRGGSGGTRSSAVLMPNGRWREQVFPTANPVSRTETHALEDALDAMLADAADSVPPGTHPLLAGVAATAEVYDVTMHELSRQIASLSSERGALLERINSDYRKFWQSLEPTLKSLQQALEAEQEGRAAAERAAALARQDARDAQEAMVKACADRDQRESRLRVLEYENKDLLSKLLGSYENVRAADDRVRELQVELEEARGVQRTFEDSMSGVMASKDELSAQFAELKTKNNEMEQALRVAGREMVAAKHKMANLEESFGAALSIAETSQASLKEMYSRVQGEHSHRRVDEEVIAVMSRELERVIKGKWSRQRSRLLDHAPWLEQSLRGIIPDGSNTSCPTHLASSIAQEAVEAMASGGGAVRRVVSSRLRRSNMAGTSSVTSFSSLMPSNGGNGAQDSATSVADHVVVEKSVVAEFAMRWSRRASARRGSAVSMASSNTSDGDTMSVGSRSSVSTVHQAESDATSHRANTNNPAVGVEDDEVDCEDGGETEDFETQMLRAQTERAIAAAAKRSPEERLRLLRAQVRSLGGMQRGTEVLLGGGAVDEVEYLLGVFESRPELWGEPVEGDAGFNDSESTHSGDGNGKEDGDGEVVERRPVSARPGDATSPSGRQDLSASDVVGELLGDDKAKSGGFLLLLSEDHSGRAVKPLTWVRSMLHRLYASAWERVADASVSLCSHRSVVNEYPIDPVPEFTLAWMNERYTRPGLVQTMAWDFYLGLQHYRTREADLAMALGFLDRTLSLAQFIQFLRARDLVRQQLEEREKMESNGVFPESMSWPVAESVSTTLFTARFTSDVEHDSKEHLIRHELFLRTLQEELMTSGGRSAGSDPRLSWSVSTHLYLDMLIRHLFIEEEEEGEEGESDAADDDDDDDDDKDNE